MSEKKPFRRVPIPLGGNPSQKIPVSSSPSSVSNPTLQPPKSMVIVEPPSNNSQKINAIPARLQLRRGSTVFKSKTTMLKPEEQLALKNLRLQVMDAIRKTDHYWLLFKYGSYGIAGFLPLKIKRIYIELIFFNSGHPNYPFILHSPNNTLIDFSGIYHHFKDANLINPLDIIFFMENSVKNQIAIIQSQLEKELEIIRSDFLILPYNHSNVSQNSAMPTKTENQYLLKLFYPVGCLDLLLNLSKYPECPTIALFEKSIDSELFKKYENEIYQSVDTFFGTWEHWDEVNPPALHSRLIAIEDSISHILNIPSALNRRSQNLLNLEKLTIGKDLQNLTLTLSRTQTLGIYAEIPATLLKLFECLNGKNIYFTGQIKLFDCIIPDSLSIPSNKLPIILEVTPYFTPKELSMATKMLFPKKARYRKHVIEIFNIESLWNYRIKFLNLYDKIKIRLAQAFLQDPDLILLSIPENQMNQLEIDNFLKLMKRLKYSFRAVIMISGPQEIIESCDQILSIPATGEINPPGNMEELAAKMPQGGEIVILELKSPLENPKDVFSTIPNLQFVELRKGERFKIIAEDAPDLILLRLLALFGDKFYNYKRIKPTLQDYLEFMSDSEKTIKI